MVNEEPREAPEIHDAIKLILERMETNPEEFTLSGFNKWQNMLERAKQFWTPEEKGLFNRKLREIRMRELHEGVMKKLMEFKEEKPKSATNQALTQAEAVALLKQSIAKAWSFEK